MRAYLASLTWGAVRSVLAGFTRSRHHGRFSVHRSDDIVGKHPIMRKRTSADEKKTGAPVGSPFEFLKRDIFAGIKSKYSRPHLKIRPIHQTKDAIIWKHHITAWKRKFITVKIENKRMETAERCTARLTFTKLPPKASHLKKEYNLRWIGSNQSFHGDDTGSIPITKGLRRLELVFSDSDEVLAGCWIACAGAFSDTGKDQVFLPAGTYHAVLRVTCGNGKGDERKYRIESPKNWEDLHVEEMK